MSSTAMIFQPLLYDPVGWKPSKSTYVDHYKWKKYRATRKDKKISTYGQQYQRQLQKQQANQCLPLTPVNGEQTINRVIVVKNHEDKKETPPISYRFSSSKAPVYIVEYKQRAVSANGVTSHSKESQRPPTAPPAVEEKTRSATASENRQSPKEEKQKTPIDPDIDNNRHWLTYPNPKTPQYILDIKRRLGQLRGPSTVVRPVSASLQNPTPKPIDRPSSASTELPQKQPTNDNQRHFLQYNTPNTPEELRATRYRIDKYRYNPSLDSYPPRPQTCPARSPENPKPTPTPQESGSEQLSSQSLKNDPWIVNEEKKPPTPDNESSSIVIQVVDCDGLPNEYVDALETANIAQEEYQKNLKMNDERRLENFVYRLPDNKNDSFIAYQNQQQSIGMNNQLRQVPRSSQNDFGVWVRNATDKERASAMKILQEVLHKPIMGYDNEKKQNTVFKQAPAPPPVRVSSATRKLGRTRTQHQFPCEICEKLLIKRHVWDLSGSETLTCTHSPQSIQVRA